MPGVFVNEVAGTTLAYVGKLVTVEGETAAGDFECPEYYVVRQNNHLYGIPVSGLVADCEVIAIPVTAVLHVREDDDAAFSRACELLHFTAGDVNEEYSDLSRNEARRLAHMIFDILQRKDEAERVVESTPAKVEATDCCATDRCDSPAEPHLRLETTLVRPDGSAIHRSRVIKAADLAEWVRKATN